MSRIYCTIFIFLFAVPAFSQQLKFLSINKNTDIPITLKVGEKVFVCDKPIKSYSDHCGTTAIPSNPIVYNQIFSFSLPDATIELRHETRTNSSLNPSEKTHVVYLTPSGKISQDITITFPLRMTPYHQNSALFTPMKNGVCLSSSPKEKMGDWIYCSTGAQPSSQDRLLAIPAIDLYSDASPNQKIKVQSVSSRELPDRKSRVLCATDPFHSTLFRILEDRIEIEWTYETSMIPSEGFIDRTIHTIPHSNDEKEIQDILWINNLVFPGL